MSSSRRAKSKHRKQSKRRRSSSKKETCKNNEHQLDLSINCDSLSVKTEVNRMKFDPRTIQSFTNPKSSRTDASQIALPK